MLIEYSSPGRRHNFFVGRAKRAHDLPRAALNLLEAVLGPEQLGTEAEAEADGAGFEPVGDVWMRSSTLPVWSHRNSRNRFASNAINMPIERR